MERLTERTAAGHGRIIGIKEESLAARLYKGEALKYFSAVERLSDYEDTGLTPEQIQAQQQEIENLKYTLIGVMHSVDKWFDDVDESVDEVNRAAQAREIALQAIEHLTADKDEQAGRIMQYDAVLKQARKALKTCEEIASSEKNQLFWTADVAQKSIKAIDALLGGKEDVPLS